MSGSSRQTLTDSALRIALSFLSIFMGLPPAIWAAPAATQVVNGHVQFNQVVLETRITNVDATGNTSAINLTLADLAGRIQIAQPLTFNDPVTFKTSNAGGSIIVANKVTGAVDASITFNGSGNTTTLFADVVTSGNPSTFTDRVILQSAITIDSTNNGDAMGGDISIGAQTLIGLRGLELRNVNNRSINAQVQLGAGIFINGVNQNTVTSVQDVSGSSQPTLSEFILEPAPSLTFEQTARVSQ